MNTGQVLQSVKLALGGAKNVFLANRIDGQLITVRDIRDIVRLIQGKGV
jgi:hypothetical protein